MGTAYNCQENEKEMGIIPRAVRDIFTFINNNIFIYDFNVKVSFAEYCREKLYNLLSKEPRDQCVMAIGEVVNVGYFVPGLTEIHVNSAQEVLRNLQQGFARWSREPSSQSHVIFTITMNMVKKDGSGQKTAKLRFVDIAMERFRAKLVKKGANVNYEESVVSRLLQESLSDNFFTLLIACVVGPSDSHDDVALATLRFADRARRLKKPAPAACVNEEEEPKDHGTLNQLGKEIQLLQSQLNAQGKVVAQGDRDVSDLQQEIADMQRTLTEHKQVHEQTQHQIRALEERNSRLEDLGLKLEGIVKAQQSTIDKLMASMTSLLKGATNNTESADAHAISGNANIAYRSRESHMDLDSTLVQVRQQGELMSQLLAQAQAQGAQGYSQPAVSQNRMGIGSMLQSSQGLMMRNLSGGSGACGCIKEHCNTMRCGCRKRGTGCSPSCRCNPAICANNLSF